MYVVGYLGLNEALFAKESSGGRHTDTERQRVVLSSWLYVPSVSLLGDEANPSQEPLRLSPRPTYTTLP